MFYSQQEAAEKLGMTEEEVKQLATEGKLREFRDGASVMFKIDEVEGLAAESGSDLDDFSAASEPVADADELDPLLEKNTIDDRPAAGAGEEVSVPEEGTAADKALDDLQWAPTLDFEETVKMTIDWYREFYETGKSMRNFTIKQIETYEHMAVQRGATWAAV